MRYHLPKEDKKMMFIAAIVGFILLSALVWDHTILTTLEEMVESFLANL